MEKPLQPPAFITAPPRRVVFLCTHNSARSQMAEGFARALAPADAVIASAGTEPRGVHPAALAVMKEVGIDISRQRSQRLDEIPLGEADTVVTLCEHAERTCPPVAPAVRRVHWPLPDPAEARDAGQLAAFREIRDEIRWRVASLWPREE